MMKGDRLHAALIPIVALLLTAGGCTAFDTPATYNRHRLSDIALPRSADGSAGETPGDIFYFDVTITPEFPDNNSTAEAERMRWLTDWLVQRNMCPTGYEIIKKRKFDYMEDNPARRDIRYEVRCKAGTAVSE
jgi:hypothetical protein